jgi:hypothetical protein
VQLESDSLNFKKRSFFLSTHPKYDYRIYMRLIPNYRNTTHPDIVAAVIIDINRSNRFIGKSRDKRFDVPSRKIERFVTLNMAKHFMLSMTDEIAEIRYVGPSAGLSASMSYLEHGGEW